MSARNREWATALVAKVQAEEQDTTTALANCRRRIRKLQEAVQTQGAQASAAADGLRQLGQSRWKQRRECG